MNIKNAVKTILDNPFNALAVTQYAIPTTAILSPDHKDWLEWRENSCRETYEGLERADYWCDGTTFEEYRDGWFSEPDYLLIDVTQLKDKTWQVVCFVDYHKPNIRCESEPEHLWQYAFETEPTLQDVSTVKMRDLAQLVQDDFISEYRDSDNRADIKARDGYIPGDDYALEITDYYRNDVDPCSHFTDAQTTFIAAKEEQTYKGFKERIRTLIAILMSMQNG